MPHGFDVGVYKLTIVKLRFFLTAAMSAIVFCGAAHFRGMEGRFGPSVTTPHSFNAQDAAGRKMSAMSPLRPMPHRAPTAAFCGWAKNCQN